MEPMITLTQLDNLKLWNLFIREEDNFSFLDSKCLSDLKDELERAQIVDLSEVPGDLVTMHSVVKYLNVSDGREDRIQIVYPMHASKDLNRISVIAPLGAALIGLSSGEEIDWSFPNGQKKRLRVLEILYQPEANGDFHL